MGMMIFVMASGLTLVFGLMDVLNFGHGAFIAVGAFMATLRAGAARRLDAGATRSGSISRRWLPAMLAAMAVDRRARLGLRARHHRPVYGQHLKQILITMGGLIVAEQLIHVIWGPQQIPLPLPPALRGSFLIGDAAIEKYRLLAVLVGLAVFVAHAAGAQPHQDRPADPRRRRERRDGRGAGLSHPPAVRRRVRGGLGAGRARRRDVGALPRDAHRRAWAARCMVLVFIVVIIGGLGSVGGCFIGALLVALMANYTGFLAPKVALVSNILLMVLILLWRPQGLYPVAKR